MTVTQQRYAAEMSALARTGAAQQRVLDAVAASPGIGSAAIARRIGRSQSAVKRALAKLCEAGVVDRITNPVDGRINGYRVSPLPVVPAVRR